jgi:hypothetical protein
MEPPPPDIPTQQSSNPTPPTLPNDDLAGPQRKRLRSDSTSSTPFLTIYDFDPLNPMFSAPGAMLLGELANLVNIFTEDEPTSLDANVWFNVCEGIASAVARSIKRIDFGDDAGHTQAVCKGMKIFSNLAQHFNMAEDANMEQDKEPIHVFPPPTFLPDPMNDTILTLLCEIQANNKSINDCMFRLENRITHTAKQQDDRKAKTNANASPPVNTSQATPSKTSRPTYAAITGNNHNASNTPTDSATTTNQGRKTNVSVTQQHPQPIQYIVRYLGHPPSQDQKLLPKIISNRINTKLSMIPSAKGLTILSSHWNTSGNCVLTFPPQTSTKLIEDHFPTIKNAMGLNENQVISHDTPWSKVTLCAVYA